ncbi:hypothetical protein QOZ80_7BG0589590 [Eleusine coracana subsp. coracana]|nr:hypothetical protein QOZ80_7BG0589590 [Eleusine coracana subsp. coracana]
MHTKVIKADTIEEAAKQILNELKENPDTFRNASSRNNVIYFDGWDGLGASAVLQAVARLLTSASTRDSVLAEMEFEQVMHIDCSKWESRRALQRVVAEQLEVPAEVMEMFDKQDKEDDYRGVARNSRAELGQVTRLMYQHMQKLNRIFLVIFHNGSSEEIDLADCCGFFLSGFSTSKVLWTFQGRYRFKPRVKVDNAMKSTGRTDAFILAVAGNSTQEQLWPYLIREEAEEVFMAYKTNRGPYSTIVDHAEQVAGCFLYMSELCSRGHQSINYDLTTHGSNYWICDGIIKQLQLGARDVGIDEYDDGLWTTADALQREMQFDVDYHQYVPSSPLTRFVESKPYWTSPTYGFTQISSEAIHNRDMFQHYLDKLRVLKLSRCTFNFPSPPFLCCHNNLRFLWLDNCQVNTSDGSEKEEEDISLCFRRLWVLDVRYTKGCNHILSAKMTSLMIQLRELNVVGAQEWDIGQLQGRLPNVRKLRVTNSTLRCSCTKIDLFSEMNRMQLLDFSGNVIRDPKMSIYGPEAVGKSSSFLEKVVIDSSYGLEKIILTGCTKLEDILLSGDHKKLRILDISSTAVKTLDLTTTTIEDLDELYLLHCKKLCAITWPPENKRKSNMCKLCIDTMQDSSFGATGTSSSSIAIAGLHGSNQSASEFDWYISVRDTRLLVSLEPVYPTNSSRKMYVEISSPTVASGDSKTEKIIKSNDLQQKPVILQPPNETDDGDSPVNMWMWPCPDTPHLPKESCYMHIPDQQVGFPKLKRIHLHELPMLHGICDPRLRMYAPELKTVIVRGCWSLKCLPIVKNAVQCYCEKEWWDDLKWEDKSQKKLYRPIHSKYHKTTQLRGSVLR